MQNQQTSDEKEQTAKTENSEQEKKSPDEQKEPENNSSDEKQEQNKEKNGKEAANENKSGKDGQNKDSDKKARKEKLSKIEKDIDISKNKLDKLRHERERLSGAEDRKKIAKADKKIHDEEQHLDDLISQYSKKQGITKDAAKEILNRPKDQRGLYTKTHRGPFFKRLFSKIWEALRNAAMYVFEHKKYEALQMEVWRAQKERAEKIIELDQLAHAKETDKTADRIEEICKDTRNPADRLRAAMNLCAETRQDIFLKYGEEYLRLSYKPDLNKIAGERDAKIVITRFANDIKTHQLSEIKDAKKVAVPCVNGKIDDLFKDSVLYKGFSKIAEKLDQDIEKQTVTVNEKDSAFKEAHKNLTNEEIDYCVLAEKRDKLKSRLKELSEMQKQEPDNKENLKRADAVHARLLDVNKSLKENPFFKNDIEKLKAAREQYKTYKDDFIELEKEKSTLERLTKQRETMLSPADRETISTMNEMTHQRYNALFRELNGRDPEEEKPEPEKTAEEPAREENKEQEKENAQEEKKEPQEINRITIEIASAETIEYTPRSATLGGKEYIVPGYGINKADGHDRFIVRNIQDPSKTLPLKISVNEANRKTQAIKDLCASHEALEQSGWRIAQQDQEKTKLEVTKYGTIRLRGEEKTLEYPIAAIEKDYPNLFKDAVITFNEAYQKEAQASLEKKDALNTVIIQNDEKENIGINLSKSENDPLRVFTYPRGEDLSSAERRQMDPQKITKEARDAILINRLDKDYKLDNLFAQEGNTSHNRNSRTPIPAPEIERNNKEKDRGKEAEERQSEER
ncbi:MAG: hypothetical protein SPL63_00890 [Roseburia faecis]|nr:hypothetical protein [Roseburia faecis]